MTTGAGKRRWDWNPPLEEVLVPAAGAIGPDMVIRARATSCGVIPQEEGIAMQVSGFCFVVRLEDLKWAIEQVERFRAGDHENIDR